MSGWLIWGVKIIFLPYTPNVAVCALEESTDIDSKIAILIEQRGRLRNAMQRLLETRQETISNIKGLNLRVRETRSTKDQLLSELRQLRGEQGQQRSKLHALNTKARELMVSGHQLGKADPYKAYEALTEKIKSIEWKLQTEPLQREEEKALVATIKELQLKRRSLEKKISHLTELNQIEKSGREADILFNEIREKASQAKAELDQLDAELDGLMEERRGLGKKIEEIDKEIFENAKKLGENQQSLSELKREEDKRVMGLRSSRESHRRKFLEEARDDAKQKFSSGNKLSFEEFKLLMSSEMDEESE